MGGRQLSMGGTRPFASPYNLSTAEDDRGISYIEKKFEWKQLRLFSGIRSVLKISDFSRIAPAFCMQRQKTAEADIKCVN